MIHKILGSAWASMLMVLGTASQAATGDLLLPDSVVWADEGRQYLYGWSLDTNQFPGRILLRLTFASPNLGLGPLEIQGGSTNENGTQNVFQNIHLEGGGVSNRLAGTFTHHELHGHIHFDDFTQYNLRHVTESNGVGTLIAGGGKTSFCLLDSVPYDRSLPGAPQAAQYNECEQLQGISVGWSDLYTKNLPDQWIDITDVPNGTYWLEVVVDPDNRLLELNETNNTASILVTLTNQPARPPGDVNGTLTVTGADSLLINQTLVGLRTTNDPIFQATGWQNGDVNQNGQVTGADSLLINQVLVGLRSFITTWVGPASRSNNVPTPVTIFGIGFPTNEIPVVTIGEPVNLTLSNVVVISREMIAALVPAGGGTGTGQVNVVATPTNGVLSFGSFVNQ